MNQPTIWGRQPVLILALIQAAIAVAVSFGLRLTGEQVGLVMALAAAILGVVVNARVTPNALLED